MSSELLKLAAVFGLILLNGFFVAAEFALVSVRPTRIDQLIERGNPMARLVKRAIADPNRFISAAQVGITMASLGLGWIAEPALANIIEPAFEGWLGDNARLSAHLVAGIVAYFIITLLHIVLGEQVPKMIAIQRSEATILATAAPITWLAIPFRPFIALLYWLTDLVLRPLGLSWQGEQHLVYTEEELKMLVTASHQQGFLESSEQEMISRVFSFHDIRADEVMVPRTEMIAFPATASLEEVTKIVAQHGHARYPVYGEDLDDIIGIFHAKDLYKLIDRGQQTRFSLPRLVRTPLMIAGSMPLDELLAEMKKRRTHVAIVLDEYGGTAGMVTLEDVLERIIGEVHDEFEADADDIQCLENGRVLVSGLVSIDQVNEELKLKLEDPFYNTIGGYVFGQLGRRPEVGDEVQINGFVARIVAMDGLRIDRLELIPTSQEAVVEACAEQPSAVTSA
ncbi:MAG TPA: hemolysin family protein [Thermomicrobiales bacterium]